MRRTIFIVQLPRVVRLQRRRYWIIAPDFPAYASQMSAEAAIEDWMDGDWVRAVHLLGGADVVESVHTYEDKAGRPVARIIELEVHS